MNSDRKKIYLLSLLFLAVLLSCFFAELSKRAILLAVVLAVCAPIVYFVIKKRDILSIYKRQVLLLMFVIALLYLMVYYLTGLHFGFYRFKESFATIIKSIILISVTAVGIETIRMVFMQQDSKLLCVIAFLVGVIADLLLELNGTSFKTFNKFMDFIGLCLFPAITLNLLLCYLVKHFGVLPGICYRLIVAIIPLFITVTPAIPQSLLSFVQLVLPIVILVFIKGLYEKKKREKKRVNRAVAIALTCVSLACMTTVIAVISCQFSICAVVIATESMTGELNKGDMVVYERFNDSFVKENEIVVFNNSGARVVHRVIKVEIVNGQYRYITKGDYNDVPDSGYITNSDIIGVVRFKIAYMGYPTLWMRSLFNRT